MKKTMKCPDETATQTVAPEELSRLRRRCIDERYEREDSQNTRVKIGINGNRTNRFMAATEKDRLIQHQEGFPVGPIENRLSADVTIVATSTRSDSPCRKEAGATLNDCSCILLDQRQEESDRRTVNRIPSFRRTVYLWSKYRVSILIAVCTIVASVFFLGNPISNNARTRLSSITHLKTSRRIKPQTPKKNSIAEVKQETDSRGAQPTTLIQDKARNPTLLPEGQSSESERSSTINERLAVDLLITGRLRAAYRRYCELALQRRDQPVYRVIARALARQIAKSHPQHALPGNDLCRIPKSE